MRCLRQALRASVSTDWWKRVLVFAPRFKKGPQPTGLRTGLYVGQPSLEFSAEMTCDAVVERVMELMQPLPTGLSFVCLFIIMCGQINNYKSVNCGNSVIVDSSPSRSFGSLFSSFLAD